MDDPKLISEKWNLTAKFNCLEAIYFYAPSALAVPMCVTIQEKKIEWKRGCIHTTPNQPQTHTHTHTHTHPHTHAQANYIPNNNSLTQCLNSIPNMSLINLGKLICNWFASHYLPFLPVLHDKNLNISTVLNIIHRIYIRKNKMTWNKIMWLCWYDPGLYIYRERSMKGTSHSCITASVSVNQRVWPIHPYPLTNRNAWVFMPIVEANMINLFNFFFFITSILNEVKRSIMKVT